MMYKKGFNIKGKVVICGLIMLAITIIGCTVKETKNQNLFKNIQTKEISDTTICRGEIYEITENNFIKGLDHSFTEDEIDIWSTQLSSVSISYGRISQDEIKYIIHLYNVDGEELFEFAAKDNFEIYSEWGKLSNEELTNLIKTIAEQT